MRVFRSFSWKDSNLRISCVEFALVTQAIVDERRQLERYIARHPAFRSSMQPLSLLDNAPESAKRMALAAKLTGTGPMAAVAGTLAQLGAEAALTAGCSEAIVENGGDMYLFSEQSVTIALHSGDATIADRLAFRLSPQDMPLAICSSSSTMGHSFSYGQCDLATVLAKSAALADAAVTMICNQIHHKNDLMPVLNDAGTIPGIQGILAIKDGKIGIWGRLPEMVRNEDRRTPEKITRDLHG